MMFGMSVHAKQYRLCDELTGERWANRDKGTVTLNKGDTIVSINMSLEVTL